MLEEKYDWRGCFIIILCLLKCSFGFSGVWVWRWVVTVLYAVLAEDLRETVWGSVKIKFFKSLNGLCGWLVCWRLARVRSLLVYIMVLLSCSRWFFSGTSAGNLNILLHVCSQGLGFLRNHGFYVPDISLRLKKLRPCTRS